MRFRTSNTYPGIPTPSAIEMPILQYVSDGRNYAFGDIYAAMVDHFCLTPEQERILFPYAHGFDDAPPSGDNVFYKYCNNACQNLVGKNWLDDGNVGHFEDRHYSITALGLSQL